VHIGLPVWYKRAGSISGYMVDLLGRTGFIREAEDIQSIPFAPDISTWGALLGACKKHG
jgi:hypothetical protein